MGTVVRLVTRGMIIAFAALSIAGSAFAAPVEAVLYNFTGESDGNNPFAGLIADEDGALYGTTANGGSYGYGAVFKLTPPPARPLGQRPFCIVSWAAPATGLAAVG
jgi:uncharacterized repeat protein (TIGR03803 family)